MTARIFIKGSWLTGVIACGLAFYTQSSIFAIYGVTSLALAGAFFVAENE